MVKENQELQGKKESSYEEKFARLQGIVEKMQEGNASLEESLTLYEDGIGLYRKCRKELEDMEMKIKVISQEGEEQEGSEAVQ